MSTHDTQSQHPSTAFPSPPPDAGAHAGPGSSAASSSPFETFEYVDGVLRVTADQSTPRATYPDPGGSLRPGPDAAWVELHPTAWLITRQSGELVHASDLVYELLELTPEELERILDDPGDSTPGFSWIRRTVIADGQAEMLLRIPLADGSVREIDVVSRRLPPSEGATHRYFSVLTPRAD